VVELVHKKKARKKYLIGVEWVEEKPHSPKKKKKPKKGKGKETKLTHAHAVFQNFAKLQVKPPLLLSEVPPAIEELKKKKRLLY